MAKLLVSLPHSGDFTHDLAGDVITIGRTPDNKIQINHDSVAPHHAQLLRINGHYRFKELSSTHKTRVNGVAVSEATLQGSCILHFGAIECVFREESPASKSDQLSEARRQIEALIRARDALHEQNRELVRQRDTAQESHESLGDELLEAQAELEKLRLEKKSVAENEQQQLAESAAALAAANEKLEALESRAAALTAEAATASQAMQAKLDAAQEEARVAAETHEIAIRRVEDLTAQNSALTETGAAEKASREAAEATLAQTQEELKKSRELQHASQSQLEAEAEQLRAGLEATSAELSTVRGELAKAAGDLETAEAMRRDAETQRAEIGSRLETATAEHAEFVGKIQGELEEARRQLEAANAAAEQFTVVQAELARIQGELEEARRQLEAANTAAEQFTVIQAELARIQGELAAAIQQRDAAEQERAAVLEKSVTLQKAADSLAAELEATRRHDEELVQQLATVREELAGVVQERAQLATANEELNSKSSMHLAQIATLTAATGTGAEAVEALQAKLAESQQRLAELSDSALSNQSALKDLTAQLETQQSQVRELTKQRDVLLETNGRLAAQIDAAARVPQPPAVKQTGESKGDPLTPAPPELASWLKRAFHKKKASSETPGGSVAAPSAMRMFAPAPANIDDPHSVSLDFLGSPADSQPAPASADRVVEPSEAAPAVAQIAEPEAAPISTPAPAPALTLENAAIAAPLPAPFLPTMNGPVSMATGMAEERPDLIKPAIPQLIAAMRRTLQYFIRHTNDVDLLHEIWTKAGEMTDITSKAGYPLLHIATTAFEALVRDLYKVPARINSSTVRTVGQSIDFIHILLEETHLPRLATMPALNAIAIEDEPEVLEGIVAALETVKLKTCATKQAKPSLSLLSAQKFDIIFLDVGLPDMNGLDLCARIRGMAQHRRTPIVFLTGMTTVEHRAQSTLKGGNDFIAKPFHLSELSMKAATWVLKGYLQMI
jgi:CheY-like chemotaxis protein/predicted  nucleic acid-binding Zn-ribbon protein